VAKVLRYKHVRGTWNKALVDARLSRYRVMCRYVGWATLGGADLHECSTVVIGWMIIIISSDELGALTLPPTPPPRVPGQGPAQLSC
jgi:hypothetical protein